MLMMVNAGKGVAFLSSRMADPQNESLHFLNLEGIEADIDLVLAWRKDNSKSAVDVFVNDFTAFYQNEYLH